MKRFSKITVALGITAAVGAALFGYMYTHGLTEILKNEPYTEGQIKVACVGDSVTYGHGISGHSENNYPRLLGGLLGEEYHVCNFGISGSTVQPDGDQPYSITEAYRESIEYEADILVFMLGSNDSKPENWQDEEKFRKDYEALLDTYLKSDKKPAVFIGIPPKAYFPEGQTEGLTNYDIQPLIVDRIAEITKEIALERGFETIDISSLTENRRDLFGKDNVHPNNEGAKLIAEEVFRTIEKINVMSINS